AKCAAHARVAGRQQQNDNAGYCQQAMERGDRTARRRVTAKVPDGHVEPDGGSECDQDHGVVEHARPPYRLFAARRPVSDAVTLQMTFPTSSATSSPPDLSTTTPTGRPRALPSSSTNPVSTSSGAPSGRPP